MYPGHHAYTCPERAAAISERTGEPSPFHEQASDLWAWRMRALQSFPRVPSQEDHLAGAARLSFPSREAVSILARGPRFVMLPSQGSPMSAAAKRFCLATFAQSAQALRRPLTAVRAAIGVERALHYTEYYKRLASPDATALRRSAESLAYHLDQRSIRIHDDELIVGTPHRASHRSDLSHREGRCGRCSRTC